MKKKIVIGLLVISALSFGAIKNTGNFNNGQSGRYHDQMMSQLSEKQQDELTKDMLKEREKNYKEGLELKTKQLELEKLLAEDKVNWKSVEKVNKEVALEQADQRLERMKYRKSIEDKYGITMGHRGMGNGNNGKGHSGGGNGMGNGNQMNGGRNRTN
jgi:Spy/CpxP family protein refolding chaperone